VVSGNSQSGISVVVPVGDAGANIFVERSAVVVNGTAGISADGAAAAAFVAQSNFCADPAGNAAP
jgi:hypothetical protein